MNQRGLTSFTETLCEPLCEEKESLKRVLFAR